MQIGSMRIWIYGCALLLCAQLGWAAPTLQWQVAAQYPHDTRHFTQGLELVNGQLLESTGLYGQSAVYLKELKTGTVLHQRRLPASWFGEGITVWGTRALLLTWREHLAYWLDLSAADPLKPLQPVRYASEGWGATHNQTHIITSDGSAELRFRNPEDLSVQRIVSVREGQTPIAKLNELEWVRGEVLANVWETDRIAIINPENGQVRAWLDLADLKQRLEKPATWNPVEHVLNGIAFDETSGLLYVTGKCWPTLFALKVEGIYQ